MDEKLAENAGPHPNQFEENQSFDCNVTVNEGEANKTRVMSIGVLNPPLKILNRGAAAAPSCSRTTPAIPIGGRGNVIPVVHYQTLHKLSTPYRIVSQTPLPPRTNTAQAFPVTNQLLSIQPGSYATVAAYTNQNYYANPPPRFCNASGSSYGTAIAPRTSAWQPAPNVLRCYYTVPKVYDDGASTSRNSPEMTKMEAIPKKAQKRVLQVSKNNLTALEAAAAGGSTNKATPSSSVANFLEQDTLRKGVEVLDSLDDQSLKLLVSKVMDLTNKMYGDYLAEELEKYLGVEKYQEIANKALNTYDEFLASRSGDVGKENNRSASTAGGIYSEPEVSSSENANYGKGQNQTVFIKMEPETSLQTNNITVNPGEVGMGQKGKGKKKRVSKAQRRVSYEIEDSLEVLAALDSSKTATLDINSIKQENDSVEMNGFAWTDHTKIVAVKVKEEISAADVFISDKIAELEKSDNLEEDFTFDDSKPKNGLPEKIFESPDDPAANTPRILSRDKWQPRKLLQVDGVDKNMEKEHFLGKALTIKDEIGETPTVDPTMTSSNVNVPSLNIDSSQIGYSAFKNVKPKKHQLIFKRSKPSLKSEDTSTHPTYLDVDVPSNVSSNLPARVNKSLLIRSQPEMSEKRLGQARKQPNNGKNNCLSIVPLPRPFPNIRHQVYVPNAGKVEPNMTPVSETTFGLDPLLSTPSEHVSEYSSSALESISSGSAKILEKALAQTSEALDVQMYVEVESNETEANSTVETTPTIEFVNGGTRGPDIVQNATDLQGKSCTKVDHEPTKDSVVNMRWLSGLPNGQGKTMPKMWQESEFVYKNNGPQTIFPEKAEKVIILQNVTLKHSLNSCKNDSAKGSSLEELTAIIKEELPEKNEHNITKVQGTQKHITLEISDEEQMESAKKDITPKDTGFIENSSLLLSSSQKNTNYDDLLESCEKLDHIIQTISTTEPAAQRPQALKDQKYKMQDLSQIITSKIMSPVSNSNQRNKNLELNSQENKVNKGNVSENFITIQSEPGDYTENCHAQLQHINLTDTSSFPSSNTTKLEEQVTPQSLGQKPQKLEKDANENPEQKPQQLENYDHDTSEQKLQELEKDDDTSEQKLQELEEDDNDTSEQKPIKLENDNDDTSEQKPIKLEKNGDDNPEQTLQKLDYSSDIETSMNDLAQLLVSLQETTPIAKGTSDTSSISNESFEKFAQNTVKTLDLETDDCILIEDEDSSTIAGEVTKPSEFCEMFVQQAPPICAVNEKPTPGTSKISGKEKVTKTDSIKKCHEDKSVRDIAQLLMDFQKFAPNVTDVKMKPDFQKFASNVTDVKLKPDKDLQGKVVTTGGSDDCILVEDTTPTRDPLEIVSASDKSILNSTEEDCVLIEVETFPRIVKYPSGNDDSKYSKVSTPPLVRVLTTPTGLKRAKESCETLDEYRTLPPRRNKAYEQGFIKRNSLSWAREHGCQQPSTSITILDYVRPPSSSGNNVPYDHYSNSNGPEKRPRLADFNPPSGSAKPTVDNLSELIKSKASENVRQKSTESSSQNYPIPVALIASPRIDINSRRSGGMAPARIIDVNLSACRNDVDTFRKLDFNSADSGSVDDVNHFITPEVTISRRTRTQVKSSEFSRQSNVKPVTISHLSRGKIREGNWQNIPGPVKVESDDCTFMDLSGCIVETPSNRNKEVVVPRIRRMREIRKRKEHQQRNFLRSKVRRFSQIIGLRIKAARRTFSQLSMIVNLINLNRNDVSLDTNTLKSKVKHLKTIYHTVNETSVAFNRSDAKQLKTALREVRTAREGQARYVRATAGKRWRDVPKKDGSVPRTYRGATTNFPKYGADTKYLFPVAQFEDKMVLKPMKTYNKQKKSIIEDRFDSNVGETSIFGNEADIIPFRRRFLENVRQSSVNRRENVEQISLHDNANQAMDLVVIKQEPPDVPEWEEVKSERIEPDPITRGIKRKASERKKTIKKEKQPAVAKTRNKRTSTVSEPTPPSKRAAKTPTAVCCSYALRSRGAGNRTIS